MTRCWRGWSSHASGADLEILRRRLELVGGDLEELAARLQRGLLHRAADAVGRLTARGNRTMRRGVGLAGLDADLVRRNAESLGRDHGEPRRRPADVGRADQDRK